MYLYIYIIFEYLYYIVTCTVYMYTCICIYSHDPLIIKLYTVHVGLHDAQVYISYYVHICTYVHTSTYRKKHYCR